MERISKKRRAKAEKPQFPKLRSKYGVNHSFRFSLRAWFNFKLYALVLLALIALAVVAFTQLEPADYSGEKFTDAFYTFDENIAEDGATSQSPIRLVGGHDIVLFAEEHEHIWSEPEEEEVVEGDCDTAKVVKITKTCACGEIDVTFETRGVVHGNAEITREDGEAATCDKDGYYFDVYTCVRCEKVTAKIQQTIPAEGHHAAEDPVEVVEEYSAPTCDTPGKQVFNYVCEDCDTVVQTVTVTLGAAHTLGTTTTTLAPTCTTAGKGKIVVECTVAGCGHVESSIEFDLAPLGHNSVETIPAVLPTCEAVGYTAETKCDRDGCGVITAAREEIPAKGHNYPLCTDAQCTECGKSRAPGAHNYAKFVIDSKAPTCTEPGYEEYYEKKCTTCGHIENEEEKRIELEALGHTGVVTCLEGFKCDRCEREEKATGHHDKNGDWYCDDCRLVLRDFNPTALLYTICLAAMIIAAIWFLILTIMLIVTAFKVSSMRLEFYDEVVVWRWGRIFKRHIEQRFIGVYDVLVMPRNKLYYKESVEKTKPAKFGTVLAKVPGGGYEWNRKFFGVKEYIQLKNYLETQKITERFERPRSNFHDDSI